MKQGKTKQPSANRPSSESLLMQAYRLISGLTIIGITVIAVLTITLVLSSAREVNAAEPLPQGDSPLLNELIAEARQSAAHAYQVNKVAMDESVRNMDYQQYRAIRFNAEHSLWRGSSAFEAQFFHPGFLYNQPVSVFDVSATGEPRAITFQPDWFRYEDSAAPLAALAGKQPGFAGFRLHYPINRQDYKDEFAVFLGASYFRLVGQGQVYGLSARALAIDTGLSSGEEFPYFTGFWLNRHHQEDTLTVYARVESPSVAGTYAFNITPGAPTRVSVKSWLFARKTVKKLGVAPFTSMFLYGENTPRQVHDYRPEVHDSDGVLMHTGQGEWIWRPLTNPARLQITSLSDDKPQGFGMLQRDREWQHYLDAEAHYHKRPGLWVTPEAGFTSGRLELVEIPTTSETNDNIVAYWVPTAPLEQGQGRYFAYTLTTMGDSPATHQQARVMHTRFGDTVLPGDSKDAATAQQRVVVDYRPADGVVLPDTARPVVHAMNGTISEVRLFPVNDGKAWRVTFLFSRENEGAVDMRLFIDSEGQQLSEVWNYVYQGL
ncbi:glucan biosynthesis protein [Alteromonas sp. CYL-A6]|uniref:glucan biosynthesis protein n=1 Tax=Alteromonas nitratireducens TaxID=3390813 RepID=UPI0034BAB85A